MIYFGILFKTPFGESYLFFGKGTYKKAEPKDSDNNRRYSCGSSYHRTVGNDICGEKHFSHKFFDEEGSVKIR